MYGKSVKSKGAKDRKWRSKLWSLFTMSQSEPKSTLRIAVLISGSGTNLQALIDAQPSFNDPSLNASIVLVFSNRKAAYGLTRASNAKPAIQTGYLALQPYLKANPGKTRDDYDAEVAKRILDVKPDLIVLAGWMHVFGDGFLDIMYQEPQDQQKSEGLRFPIPVINLHPALPGAFDGAHAIDRAWDAFQTGELQNTGVMVHRVVKKVDAGDPILIREIPFRPDETKEQFEERLHGVEWTVIVEATAIVLRQRQSQYQ